jgi:hypothetical protein
MIYETSKQENGTCDSCGYTSWKYEDSSLPHNEEICLSSTCRYAMKNGRSEVMDRLDWTRFLSTKANPDLTMRKV